MSALKLLLKAESIIQRDAILAALKAANIEATSPPRDISRKMTDETVDLSFEGISAMFDGFAIHVDEGHIEEAQKVAESVLKTARKTKDDPVLARGDSMRKFYFCSVFTMVIPIPLLFHGLGIYHLVMGLKNGERPHWFYGGGSAVLFALSLALYMYAFKAMDIGSVLRALTETL